MRVLALAVLAAAGCGGSPASTTLDVQVDHVANAGGSVVVKQGGQTVLSCSAQCTAQVPSGSTLEITATADDGAALLVFDSPCGGAPSCTTAWRASGALHATFRPAANLAFMSAKTVSMPLGSTGAAAQLAADGFCQAQAVAAKLPGRYVAWLSTRAQPAPSKLAGSSGWVRTDGRPFAATATSLAHGEIFYPLDLDENALVPWLDPAGPDRDVSILTGTHADGVPSDANCTDYTSNSGAVTVGEPMNGAIWTDFPFNPSVAPTCASQLALACLEVGADVAVQPHATGRVAFLSTGGLTPGAMTRDDADALCGAEATTAKLPGQFLALLATRSPTDGAPLARFDVSDGSQPWVRVDGVQLATTAAGLAARTLLAPVGVTADKRYRDDPFWTGSADANKPAAANGLDNCDDWTSTSGTGNAGSADRDDLWYVELQHMTCAFPQRVLCLQK
ncbi:MAG: hypothetical protein ACXVDD_12980 [Polyangia bacterium]